MKKARVDEHALVPRTEGERAIAGAAPPAEGPLAPVPGGWVLLRAEGSKGWRHILPKGVRGPVVALVGGGGFVSVAALLLVEAYIGFIPPTFAFAPALLAALLAPRFAERRVRRLFARAERVTTPGGVPPGKTITVRGRVLPGPTFETLAHRKRAVLVRYVGQIERVTGKLSDGASRFWSETRGIDFLVGLGPGEWIRVDARAAQVGRFTGGVFDRLGTKKDQGFADPLTRHEVPIEGGTMTFVIYEELSVGPGDEVEILGVIEQELDPDVPHLPRQMPVSPVLRASRFVPLVVRPWGG